MTRRPHRRMVAGKGRAVQRDRRHGAQEGEPATDERSGLTAGLDQESGSHETITAWICVYSMSRAGDQSRGRAWDQRRRGAGGE
jgi:hypothetical protein